MAAKVGDEISELALMTSGHSGRTLDRMSLPDRVTPT